MRRSPLPRSRRGLARRVGLAPMSAKRKAEAPARAAVVAEVLARDGQRCRAAGLAPGPCGGPLDVHEVIPRSVRPGAHLDPTGATTICRTCHQWVTDHPLEAHALGLHKFSWEA